MLNPCKVYIINCQRAHECQLEGFQIYYKQAWHLWSCKNVKTQKDKVLLTTFFLPLDKLKGQHQFQCCSRFNFERDKFMAHCQELLPLWSGRTCIFNSQCLWLLWSFELLESPFTNHRYSLRSAFIHFVLQSLGILSCDVPWPFDRRGYQLSSPRASC